jgi:hypothetical protein
MLYCHKYVSLILRDWSKKITTIDEALFEQLKNALKKTLFG